MSRKFDFSIQWHITSNCINRCKHCYMYTDDYTPDEVSPSEFIKQYRSILDFEDKYEVRVPSVHLTGGSPILHPYHSEIIQYLHNRNIDVFLMDIPEIVNDSTLDELQKWSIKQFQMSLDGLETTHDAIRGEGSFERTISACKKLIDIGISPRIMYTLHRANKNEMFELINQLDKQLDMFKFSFDYLVSEGAGKCLSGDFSAEEVYETLCEYYDFAKSFNIQNKQKLLGLKPSQFHVIEAFRSKTMPRLCDEYSVVSGCLIGWSSIAILPNGDVLPCRRLPIVIGNLNKDSFEDIFLGSKLLRKFRRYSEYMRTCGNCSYALYCRGCPAVNYGKTGDCFSRFDCYLKQEATDVAKRAKIPAIDVSYEEEFEYIMNTMNNKLANNYEKVLYGPNALRAFQAFKSDKTGLNELMFNKREWIQKTNIDIEYDARYLLCKCFNPFDE